MGEGGEIPGTPEAKIFPRTTSLVEFFYFTGRTFFCRRSLETLVYCLFSHISLNVFGQNEGHICFSQSVLR